MKTPVVLISDELAPATVKALGSAVEVRQCDGTNRPELIAAVTDIDALIVRSATRVDPEVIAAAPQLKIIARAGVGLDNIDLAAATQAGVAVVNAPSSNTVTAAELTCGLILSSARHIPQASAALKGGEWKRSKYVGVELAGKTLGIVGLGCIGRLVADRMAVFGMRVIAHDPYVSPQQAARTGVELLPFDALLEASDFITVHVPKTPETVGLIGRRELNLVKPGVRIINAARGGIVDEGALASALEEGCVAGAALDVFAVEPCTDSPLFSHENVIVTPRLGAATVEAQGKAGIAVAGSVRRVLEGGLTSEAVNGDGGVLTEEVRPFVPLAENLGRIFAALIRQEDLVSLHIEVHGEIIRKDVKILELSVLKGVLTDLTAGSVTWVNARPLVEQRVRDIRFVTSSESAEHSSLVTVHGTLANGETVSVSGTLAGTKQIQKLAVIDDFSVDLTISDHMLLLRYKDVPGMIGTIGEILGEAGINIAVMQVARRIAGGEAMVTLAVDSKVPSSVVAVIADTIRASSACYIDLAPRADATRNTS